MRVVRGGAQTFQQSNGRATPWHCPEGVVLLPVTDLMFPLPFALIWRQDNVSPLLTNFVADAKFVADYKTVSW